MLATGAKHLEIGGSENSGAEIFLNCANTAKVFAEKRCIPNYCLSTSENPRRGPSNAPNVSFDPQPRRKINEWPNDDRTKIIPRKRRKIIQAHFGKNVKTSVAITRQSHSFLKRSHMRTKSGPLFSAILIGKREALLIEPTIFSTKPVGSTSVIGRQCFR